MKKIILLTVVFLTTAVLLTAGCLGGGETGGPDPIIGEWEAPFSVIQETDVTFNADGTGNARVYIFSSKNYPITWKNLGNNQYQIDCKDDGIKSGVYTMSGRDTLKSESLTLKKDS